MASFICMSDKYVVRVKYGPSKFLYFSPKDGFVPDPDDDVVMVEEFATEMAARLRDSDSTRRTGVIPEAIPLEQAIREHR